MQLARPNHVEMARMQQRMRFLYLFYLPAFLAIFSSFLRCCSSYRLSQFPGLVEQGSPQKPYLTYKKAKKTREEVIKLKNLICIKRLNTKNKRIKNNWLKSYIFNYRVQGTQSTTTNPKTCCLLSKRTMLHNQYKTVRPNIVFHRDCVCTQSCVCVCDD